MSSKQPRLIFDNTYAFAPNRATLGGTAYFIVEKDQAGDSANLLIDAPANDPDILQFITERGGVRYWVITHRGGSGETKALQAALQCTVLVQEQEAYLLPDVPNVVPFSNGDRLGANCEILWTPGHSPGSACVYLNRQGGVLFTGRHLLPDRDGKLKPLRFSKTFHWPRQLKSVESLQARFAHAPLAYACPAANTGFLRGHYVVKDANAQLQAIDTTQLKNVGALL